MAHDDQGRQQKHGAGLMERGDRDADAAQDRGDAQAELVDSDTTLPEEDITRDED